MNLTRETKAAWEADRVMTSSQSTGDRNLQKKELAGAG